MVLRIVLFLTVLPLFYSATVQVNSGKDSQPVNQTIKTGESSSQHPGEWNSYQGPSTQGTGTGSSSPSSPADPTWQRAPHIINPSPTAPPGTAVDPNVLLDPASAIPPPGTQAELVGRGTKTLVAATAGNLRIEPFLWTHVAATMTVRLYDASGTEVLFGGQPLLYWQRPDGSTNSPLKWKGVVKPGSMVEQNPGDWSARSGLAYTHPIPVGYKVVLKVSPPAPDPGTKLTAKIE